MHVITLIDVFKGGWSRPKDFAPPRITFKILLGIEPFFLQNACSQKSVLKVRQNE